MSTETMSGTAGLEPPEQSPKALPTIIAAANITAEQVKEWGRLIGGATKGRTIVFRDHSVLSIGAQVKISKLLKGVEHTKTYSDGFLVSPSESSGNTEPRVLTIVIPQAFISNRKDKRKFTKLLATLDGIVEIPSIASEEADPLVLEALDRSESKLWGLPDQDPDYYDVHHGLSSGRKPKGQFSVDG